MNAYQLRIARAQAIAAQNEALPEVLHCNSDGTSKHPFRAAFALVQLPELTGEVDSTLPLLTHPDPAVREQAEERMDRIRRRIENLEN